MGLIAEGVRAGYGGAPVLDGVDLTVGDGELVAVVGPNGSGKTTLLRALAGTLALTAGRVEAQGKRVDAMTARERARCIGVVPQTSATEFAFTVREVVEMGRTPYLTGLGSLSKADHAAVDGALARSGLASLADRDATTLSAGQAQLIAVARALAQEPKVLLLDEPTAHLDVTHQIEIMEGLRKLVRDGPLAAVAVLHDLNLAATFADRIVMLHRGRARAAGTPSQVLTRANVAATFGLDVLVRRHPVSGAYFVVPLRGGLDDESASPQGTPRRRVHLVCGGGTGAPLMDALTRRGLEVSVGVVNVLDTDFEVAEALGLRVVAEAPFSELTKAALDEASILAAAAEAVVLTAVPLGRANVANLAVLEAARAAGRRVFVVDPEGLAARDFTGGEARARVGALLSDAGGARPAASADDVVAVLGARSALPPAA